jgi:isocitrate/isopropylmalate dehydrogenase
MKIAVFAGDGIGPEVTREALRVLDALALAGIELEYGDVGGVAYRNQGHPCPKPRWKLRAAPMASCLAPWVISIATICRAICARSRPFWVCARN